MANKLARGAAPLLTGMFMTAGVMTSGVIDNDGINIIDLENSHGQTSRIVTIDREDYRAFRAEQGELNPVTEFFFHYNYDFRNHVKTNLAQNGFSEVIADTMAHRFSRAYHPSSGYQPGNNDPLYISPRPLHDITGTARRSFGPNAQVYDANGHSYDLSQDPAVSDYCSIAQMTSIVDGDIWATSFTGLKNHGLHLTLDKQEYGEYFPQFVRLHEMAHCMGADEPQADYVAAKILLKDSADQEKAADFINTLLKPLRTVYSIASPYSDKYHGTSNALGAAVTEFRQGGLSEQEHAAIWSQAVERQDFGQQEIAGLSDYLRQNFQTAIENGEIEILAGHLQDLMTDQSAIANPALISAIQIDINRIASRRSPAPIPSP